MKKFNLNEYIISNFRYDPINGHILRIDRKNSNGSYDKSGYLILKIKGKQYKGHRVAWFLHYGRWPKKLIDHINNNPKDNSIKNLREADYELNANNINNPNLKKINKDTGVVGVYLDKCTKGLKKRYTTKFKNKTYRFYTLKDAIKFKKKVREFYE